MADGKPVPVTPDMVISPASNSIQTMLKKDPSLKDVEQDVADKYPIHKQFMASVGAGTAKGESAEIILKPRSPGTTIRGPLSMARFKKGDVVYDMEKMMNVVVLKPCVGYSNKGTPFTKVADGQTGETWYQLEKRLSKRKR